tara:strand:- start:699 stop:1352 length:654 start_codon:yes stop_codon:yes gene_type:complete
MKLIKFKSDFPLTPFCLNYNHFILENNIEDGIDIDEMSKLMFDRESELLEENNKTYKNDDNVNSDRYRFFNEKLYDKKCVKDFIEMIKNNITEYTEKVFEPLPEKLWLKMWCNILREGQNINIHQHRIDKKSYLSGNLCLNADNTKTHFLNPQTYFYRKENMYSSENKKGNLTIFPSILPHYTDMVTSDKPRITIAFDIMIENEQLDSFSNNVLRLI